MPITLRCEICAGQITGQEQFHYEITAWVEGKGGKGSSLAKPTGRHAHTRCVRQLKLGINPEQRALL